ncbi:hypothetical protein Verru16b_01588 [Lacunisphaera limnophila]|uniref:Ice-binding protein C-terminal domain-containing protein n=1 Tax=Lacunisphaera limnophila TaxID=1838286 RepID=A0A1D8AUI3_9BACT|nr:PEP-CTERM sorting domain-containing protein [Lacunisphaera limnophila]AOS44526.1 hypothetical protein Verru16b_01588 [Lacunisphaera limnophila]
MKFHASLFRAAAFALLTVCSASAQAIVGAWSFGNTVTPSSAGTGVLVFLDNGVYFHIESENVADAANGTNGMERGTYTWNSTTDAFTATTLVNSNGQWGLSHGVPPNVAVSGNTMTIDSFTLTRVQPTSSAIVGAWAFGNTATPTAAGTGVLVFLDNGIYFHAESENVADAANGTNGMERGTYTWNPTTDAFSAATLVNSNGQWGFSHGAPLNVAVSGNTMSIESFTLTRVSAVPEPSTYAMFAGLGALGLVVWRRRRAAA